MDKYTILIGSYARKTQSRFSDVDVVRINHEREVDLDKIGSNAYVSYVDFTTEQFMRLYSIGSLFLKHVFLEGELLGGSQISWTKIKEGFKVTKDFEEPIDEYDELLRHLNSNPTFYKAFVPYLSNFFKAAKNIGIFKLAKTSVYQFDKKMALMTGANMDEEMASLLIRANDSFERDASATAHELKSMLKLAQRLYFEGNERINEILR